jgi:hypothetical protein
MHEISSYSAVWIGFYTTKPQNPTLPNFWTWIDGTPAIFTDWVTNAPYNLSTNCVYMYSSGSPYNDGRTFWSNSICTNCTCSAAIPYICKQFPICG